MAGKNGFKNGELEHRRQDALAAAAPREERPRPLPAIRSIKSIQKNRKVHPAVWIVGIVVLAGVAALLAVHFSGLHRFW